MYIEKLAQQVRAFRRPYAVFPDARTGFEAFLRPVMEEEKGTVLLPAYVGWSPREGSGVFDPIEKLGLSYGFYRMDDSLRIELDHLETCLKSNLVRVLVLIHYFGFVDPAYEQAVSLARRYGAMILEDEAHAMLTDLVGGLSGRLGDACIFSLHKLLPLRSGGMLIVNNAETSLLTRVGCRSTLKSTLWEFDLKLISERRERNACLLSQLLQPLEEYVSPLWGKPQSGEVPQTYPVFIQTVSRDEVYFAMNKSGFGVVSLYHTMIDQIPEKEFPTSHRISRQILNLPVHQDIMPSDLEALVEQLARCVKSLPII